jgi:hypothetical protein
MLNPRIMWTLKPGALNFLSLPLSLASLVALSLCLNAPLFYRVQPGFGYAAIIFGAFYLYDTMKQVLLNPSSFFANGSSRWEKCMISIVVLPHPHF